MLISCLYMTYESQETCNNKEQKYKCPYVKKYLSSLLGSVGNLSAEVWNRIKTDEWRYQFENHSSLRWHKGQGLTKHIRTTLFKLLL